MPTKIRMFHSISLLLLWSVFLLFTSVNKVNAAPCSTFNFSVSNPPPSTINCGSPPTPYSVTIISGNNQLIPNQTYTLGSANADQQIRDIQPLSTAQPTNQSSITFSVNSIELDPGKTYYHKILGPSVGNTAGGCTVYDYKVSSSKLSGNVYITQSRTVTGATPPTQTCYGFPAGCLESGSQIQVVVENVKECGAAYANKDLRVEISGPGGNLNEVRTTNDQGTLPTLTHQFNQPGNYKIVVRKPQNTTSSATVVKAQFPVRASGDCGDQCQTSKPIQTPQGTAEPYKICEQIDRNQDHLVESYNNCIKCVGGSETNPEGIWTAIGCIKRDPTEIVQNLLKVGLGMGGGVALLMILAAGFLFSISQGDPKRTGEAKELITAAITGLLFIIFSVVILQFIGYTVLQIPGFGG